MAGSKDIRVAIIGGGVGGLAALIKLRESGISDVALFEKAPDLGGTWHYNRYPGLACDVPSHAYRYSFAPNAEWSHVCASGAEIKAYLKSVARQYDVERFMHFGHEVTQAAYRDDGRWALTTNHGEQGCFDAVIVAVGPLHHPRYPDIPGLDSFAGRVMHTAEWDDAVALDGRRIGIIGTGSTSVQLTSALVPRAKKLSLFQRTAQWMRPLDNSPIPEEQKAAYRANPALLDQVFEQLNTPDPSRPNFASAVVGDDFEAMAALQKICQDHLDNSVMDPVLKAKLTPDYPAGCKRLIGNTGFYEAIQQPNAELVTEKIERIEPAGVRTSDGRLHEIDVLALATGFDAHRYVRPMQVTGLNGVTLDEAWAVGAKAYLCVSVPQFPNWFMIGGPQSPIGNFSWITTTERQIGYILQLLELLREGKARAIAPKISATEAFNQAVKDRLPQTVWSQGCSSWYIDKFGNVNTWPWSLQRFKDEMKAPKLECFDL